EQLTFCEVETGGSVAADRDTDEAGTAAFALSFPDRVEDARADTFKIPVNALALDLHRQAVLRAHVLATAALQDQADLNVGIGRLLPVENRTSGPKIVARVGSINAVDGVLPQITFCRRSLDRLTTEFLKFELIHSTGRFKVKADRPGVLANR